MLICETRVDVIEELEGLQPKLISEKCSEGAADQLTSLRILASRL